MHETSRSLQARLVIASHRRAPPLAIAAGSWTQTFRHPHWVLDLVDGGGMRCSVDTPGCAADFDRPSTWWHLYAPGTGYRENYRQPRRVREDMWVLFDLDAAPPPLGGRRFAVVDDVAGRMAAVCRRMAAVQERPEAAARALAQALLEVLLAELLLAAAGGGAGTPEEPWRLVEGRGGALLRRVDGIVRRRIADPPSVAGLAEALAMSPSSLSHRFRAEAGSGVAERIRWLRIQEARRLLGDGASVKEAAAALGFSSAAHLARVFRDVAGMTPGDYARRVRRGEGS